MATRRKSSFTPQLVIRFIISASLIVYLINMIDWKVALEMIKEGSLFYFAAAFIAIQLTVVSSIWKWLLLVHSSATHKEKQEASFNKLGRLYYIGLFLNNFLPGSVGGDLVRIVYLGKITDVSRATASVAVERLTSGVALIAIVFLSSFFMENARPYLFSLSIIIGSSLILYLLIRYWVKRGERQEVANHSNGKLSLLMEKGKQAFIKFGATALDYRNEGLKWWLSVVILSFFFQIGLAWINDLLFLSFGIDLPWLKLLVIITLISVITMLPVSLNGIGVREASYVFFFKELDVPDEIAVSVSLLFFFLVSLSSLVGGLFWLVERRRVR